MDRSEPDKAPQSEGDGELDMEEARRRTLLRLGIYGAATAPALLAVLKSEKAIAQTGGGIPGGEGIF